jgi:hypothetical protein
MGDMIENLGSSGYERFKLARQYLLLNEDVQLVCQTREGFLVLSNRRIVLLKEETQSKYNITKAIPYDCIIGFEPKKADRFEVSASVLDQFGKNTGETMSFEIRAPKGETKSRFQSTMEQFSEVVHKIGDSTETTLDWTYLTKMPESLTHNAILDLNTVLRDQPVHDKLVHEAVKFLGAEPFLLEESLRVGEDRNNGVLFAAGTKGYYLVRGKKQGRFMINVIVDTVEWENVRCFAHQWHRENGIIYATYSLTGDGKVTTTEYQWSLPLDEDTLQYPWLLQRLNGPWILADISYRYSGRPLAASWEASEADLHKPRYYR